MTSKLPPMTNREEQIAFITRKCVKANPKLKKSVHTDTGLKHYNLQIRISDVLLSLDEKYNKDLFLKRDLLFFEGEKGSLFAWNLRKDDLTEQSDECISFLANLLK